MEAMWYVVLYMNPFIEFMNRICYIISMHRHEIKPFILILFL